MLELERGEDIDTVQNALFSNEDEQTRLLEQIKQREKNLTIRSPEAVETMASFYEHLLANPELDLHCRYITNAKIGKERPSYLPKRIPAISAWNRLHDSDMDGVDQAAALGGIRRLLSNRSKPEGLNQNTWMAYVSFIASSTDDELLNFIRRIEWKAEVTTFESLRSAVQQALVSIHNVSPDTVEALYERLFFYVFNLLSAPGIKRLTIIDLQTQLELHALSAPEQRLFEKVKSLLTEVSELTARVSALEDGFEQQKQNIKQIESGLGSLTETLGVAVTYDSKVPQLDLPILSDQLIRRDVLVSRYLNQLTTGTWIALHGAIGRGKSYLLRLIAEGGQHPIWIRLDRLSGNRACIRIDEALYAVSGTRPTPYRQRWFDRVCAELEPGTLIALHDLPRMSGEDALSQNCMMLARACAAHNIKIVSSNSYDLPASMKETLEGEVLLVDEAPSFTDDEIRELFEIYGARDEFLSERSVEWIALLTQQNAMLLVAAVRYLAANNWDLGANVFDGIVRGAYAQEVNERTRILLSETVTDDGDRELLYRLNLKRGAFTDADLRCVSEVTPIITFPNERLARVLGLWIERDTAETYTTSPLLNQLGGADLEAGVRRSVHLALGDAILEKRLLRPPDVIDAVLHFHSGEAFNKAGVVLTQALTAVQQDDSILDDWGVSDLWYNLPLPSEMDLNIRLMIRARQIAVCHKLGKNVEYLVSDLDRLLGQATDENAAWIVGAAVMVGPPWIRENPIRANQYLLRALRALPHAVLKDGRRLTIPAEAPLESLIWLNAYGIKSTEDLRDWLSTIEQFTTEQRRTALQSEAVQSGCLIAATSSWLLEQAKPVAERDWDIVLSTLEELTERAKGLNLELLWARSINTRIRILGQYKDSLDAAEILAREAMASATNDPIVRFVIQEGIGSQLVMANRLTEGLPWLAGALAEDTGAYGFERLTALLLAGRAAGETDPALALAYTERAVEIGETWPGILEFDLIKALGENAVARWLSGDLPGAYPRLRDAVARLLAIEQKNDEWKALVVLLSHVLGYLCMLAKHGRPPEFGIGGKPYEAPVRGSLLLYRPEITDYYTEVHKSYLPGSVASFAEGIGKNEEAAEWAVRAFDIARDSNDRDSRTTLGMLALGYLILNDRFAEALDVARDIAVTATAANAARPSSKDHLAHGFDASAALGDSNERWQQVERYGTLLGLVPAMLRIATVRIRDAEQARSSARLVASACREISQNSFLPDLWNSAGQLFDLIFTEEIDPEKLLDEGNAFDVNEQIALRAICYIGASLEAVPHEAFQIHMAILPFIQEHFLIFLSLHRQTLVPFVEAFWLNALQASRFLFINPREVELQLEVARSQRDDTSVQRILGVISTGLGDRVDDDARRWLNQR